METVKCCYNCKHFQEKTEDENSYCSNYEYSYDFPDVEPDNFCEDWEN